MRGPLLIIDEPVTTDGTGYASNYSWFNFGSKLICALGGGNILAPTRLGSLESLSNRCDLYKGVSIVGAGYYESFKQYYMMNPVRRNQMHKELRRHIEASDFVVARAPCQMARQITSYCSRYHKPLVTIYAGDFLSAASPLQSGMCKRLLLAPIARWIDEAQRRLGAASAGIISIGSGTISRYNLAYIPNMVTSTATISSDDIHLGMSRELNVSSPLRAIRIASYLPNKNYELLFRVIQQWKANGWMGRLDCYGMIKDVQYFERLKASCPEGVSLHPAVKAGAEVQDKLRSADVQIICSRSEGIPRTILEGAAAGVALVAIPVGGISSIVEDGANALFATGSTDDIVCESLVSKLQELDLDRSMLRRLVGNGFDLALTSTREKRIEEMANFISAVVKK